jgi:multidrug resistance efflux pump
MRTRLDDFRVSQRQNDANMATLKAGIEVLRKSHGEAIKSAKADVDRSELDVKTIPVRSAIQSETFRLTEEETRETYKMVLNEIPLMETSLNSQWKAQQLAYQEGQAELKQLEANLDTMSLKAPIDGLVVIQTVNRRGSSDAAQIKTGDSVGYGQPVVQIVDLRSMLVNASVNQVDAEQLRVGAKAYVHIDAFPELELPGRIYSLGAMTRQSRLRVDYVKEIPVTVTLLKTDPRVIPDLSASADVVVSNTPKALIVPREAVFRDRPDGRPYLFVQGPSGWARREVELGPVNFILTSIRSGVGAGEVVARERPPETSAKKKEK